MTGVQTCALPISVGLGDRETLGLASDQGRGSPEGPSPGPHPPPSQPACVTLSLLAGASELDMGEESPWCWQQRWQGGGGKGREAASSLVAHPHAQGPGPLQGASQVPPLSFPPYVCVSPFFSASPSSIPSLYVPVSLSPSTSPQFSLAASLSPVATVNDLACRGLDKLGEKLPFLQQPSETVPSTTRLWGSCRGWRWQDRKSTRLNSSH